MQALISCLSFSGWERETFISKVTRDDLRRRTKEQMDYETTICITYMKIERKLLISLSCMYSFQFTARGA